MGKKRVNDDKPAGYAGKSVSGNKTKPNQGGGERNVGTHGAEEHSRVSKRPRR